MLYFSAHAQERNTIELLGAKDLKFDKKMGIDAQRLIGDVRFRHKGALMWCDSAYLYNATNSLDAYGHVRVLQGDTLDLRSEKLYYDGNTQFVKVRDSVLLNDGKMTLSTNHLDFDRRTGIAVYYGGGTITSTANSNVLVSDEGRYNSDIKYFYFRKNVELTNPKYRVETDTLNYDNYSEIAYFMGPTYIYSEENTIYCENGWYDTRNDLSQFNENAWIDNGKQILRGDSLFYNRTAGLGKGYRNVSVFDREANYIIKGQKGTLYELTSQSVMTGKAHLIQYDKTDSLYLAADTLFAMGDSATGKKVLAYPHVRFYRTDLQGVSDSLVYASTDSMIYMYRKPVVWSENLQITGDTMEIATRNNRMHRLYVFQNAFMADRLDSTKYHQIKGRKLTGYFRDNELYKAQVDGNGESLYYAEEESKPPPGDTLALPVKNIMGVNISICSSIAIYMNERKVQTIRFLVKPKGRFVPLFMLKPEEAFFKGFVWYEDLRPINKDDIFRKFGPEEIHLIHTPEPLFKSADK
jgi:lipopolysaccharide export system protein LptA